MGEFFKIISLSVMTKSVCDPGNFFVLPLSFIQIAKISSYKELQEDYHLIADIQLREKRLPMWSKTRDVSWIYQRAIIARPRSTGYAPVDGLDAKLRLNLFFFLLPRCYIFNVIRIQTTTTTCLKTWNFFIWLLLALYLPKTRFQDGFLTITVYGYSMSMYSNPDD